MLFFQSQREAERAGINPALAHVLKLADGGVALQASGQPVDLGKVAAFDKTVAALGHGLELGHVLLEPGEGLRQPVARERRRLELGKSDLVRLVPEAGPR